VLDHQLQSARVANEGLVARVVKSVGQIATKDDVVTEVLLLADSERPAEDTHVRVDSHQNNVVPTFLFEKVVDLLPVIADAVVADDLDRGVLMSVGWLVRPGNRVIAASHLGFTSLHVIDDWPLSLMPALNWNGRLCLTRVLHACAVRCIFIMFYAAARRMNDRDALIARQRNHFVHAGSHPPNTHRCQLARMVGPHIADNDCRFGRIPFRRFFDHAESVTIFNASTPIDRQFSRHRMELSALISAYETLPEDASVVVYTDSRLCVDTITKWADGWERRGWKRKGSPLKNLDLVKPLFALYKAHPNCSLQWIEAHSGYRWNEYADSLATAWMRYEK